MDLGTILYFDLLILNIKSLFAYEIFILGPISLKIWDYIQFEARITFIEE